MSKQNENLGASLERGRLAVRLSAITLLAAFALALTVYLASSWAGIVLFKLGLIPFALAALFALLAVIEGSFFTKTLVEEEEKQILEKRKENTNSLLDISEDVRFTAERSLLNFKRYVPSVITLLCFLSMGGAIVYFWGFIFPVKADELMQVLPRHAVNLAVLAAIMATVSFFLGVFVIGQSHVKEYRWLRPAGAWMIAGAVMMLLTGVTSLLIASDQVEKVVDRVPWEQYCAKACIIVLVILTVELLINFVIEFYRPRSMMTEDRPVYESRVLSAFMEPGGLVRNIAETLDYQFGFKISKTSLYGIFERSVIPALLIWGVVLWLFTSVAEVGNGEVGIRESFGAVSTERAVLQPGVHAKLPWPFGRIIRIPVDSVQEIVIGTNKNGVGKIPEGSDAVVLWTGSHNQAEEGFLVASEKTVSDLVFPVSILEVALQVNYAVDQDQVYDYAFRFQDVPDTLKLISETEATNYFASSDFMKVISSGREAVTDSLRKQIQKSADQLGLGIKIVCVNMYDAHPPVGGKKGPDSPEAGVNVAEAFQNVVCATEEAATMMYQARAYEITTLESAKVAEMQILGRAEAYKYEAGMVANADAARFNSQLTAFRAMPFMFKLRTYLDFLEKDCSTLRKYIVSASIPYQIYEMNLEEKPKLDLLDTDFDSLGK